MGTWFTLLCFKTWWVQFFICLAAPPEFVVVLKFVRSIVFDAFQSWILHEKVAWPHLQQFLHWSTPRFILASRIVVIYPPKLKHQLIRYLAFFLLWKSQMSIHMINMSDFGKTLITLGFEANLMSLKMWFCLSADSTSLMLRRSWDFSFGKYRMPVILRYNLD